MLKTRLTDALAINLPIIQGGLAYLAYSELAAAVSNAGGLGQLTAMTCSSPEDLRDEIHKIRQLTDRPFGVNFAIGQHGRPYEEMLQVAIDEGVPVVSITGGNPTPVFEKLNQTPIKKLVLVATKRQAIKAEALGADAVMVVGNEGGGHLGREEIGGLVLIPSVVDAVNIPVIASGGFSDGRGLMAALALGAEGVEMGTRFIATKECVHASKTYQEMILKADETDTVIIKKSLGAPARALKNDWTASILREEEKGSGYEGLKALISGERNKALIYDGKMEEGFGWAGQTAGRIQDIPTVQTLFDRIMAEAHQIRAKWGTSMEERMG
ncbi:nitronate monooxygenase family protein [Pullulanibacillus sp. KACC 23026]|uniref:NAD(P)H-dependent flavin oxidoreductase n=1 Tax=Pullulanibacillus sp. KACC 23026 TaxID=3028315 RepID=UPI0023B06461|nr:nitronate monooxygenase family protein [Pullulanibacillus sp. KACC 23026]WEG15012.1 nitronate monooxygenase family protein [Pullulanibacillus sp. KACC 23026]